VRNKIKKLILYSSILIAVSFLVFPTAVFGALKNNQVPSEYIPLYQAVADEYDLEWELIAAVHNEETTFSQGLATSSAGAIGHTQFMKCTWIGWSYPGCSYASEDEFTDLKLIKKHGGYGLDANGDGKADPWDIEDSMYTAGNYLSTSMGDKRGESAMRKALKIYNHSDKYVNDVMAHYDRYKKGYEAVDGLGGVEYNGNGGSGVSSSSGDNSSESTGSSNNRAKGLGLFSNPNISDKPNTGVGIGEASIGWEVGNWITKITEGTYKWLLVIGWIVGALFILYMAVCILLYVLTLRGNSDGDIFRKITRIDNPYGKETLWVLVKRITIGVLIFSFFASGAFIPTMSFLFTFLARLPLFS